MLRPIRTTIKCSQIYIKKVQPYIGYTVKSLPASRDDGIFGKDHGVRLVHKKRSTNLPVTRSNNFEVHPIPLSWLHIFNFFGDNLERMNPTTRNTSLRINCDEPIAITVNAGNMPGLEEVPSEKLKPSSFGIWSDRAERSFSPKNRTKKSEINKVYNTSGRKVKTTLRTKRAELLRGIKEFVDLSFHMTVSSISSVGSFTTSSEESEDDERNRDNDGPSYNMVFPLFLEPRFEVPLSGSLRSTRSSDRWGVSSQDSLPRFPSRSFEIPKSSTGDRLALIRNVNHSSGDTMPEMPSVS